MFGMETYITATSGTSIGAMNGCMYGYGNLEKAVEMWRHVSKEDILYVDKDEVRNIRERIRKGTSYAQRRKSRRYSLFAAGKEQDQSVQQGTT